MALACAVFTLTVALKLRVSAQGPMAAMTPQQIEFFEANIRPVLVGICGDCHISDSEGDLKLDSRDAMLKGGENGPAIVPGDPANSRLMHAIRRDEGLGIRSGRKRNDIVSSECIRLTDRRTQ